MGFLKIIAIDTSGKTASAAINDGERILAQKSIYTSLTHSQIMLPIVKELMSDTSLDFADFDGIVCANGPGSYTGIRIGIATVKGICLGQPSLKCAGISTLEALAYNCLAYHGEIVSVMSARKGIYYCGIYKSDGIKLKSVIPDKVCSESELKESVSDKAVLVGDCCEEVKASLFGDKENVICAPFTQRLQNAASLCLAFEANPDRAVSADRLEAAYLQQTKAEKDAAHR